MRAQDERAELERQLAAELAELPDYEQLPPSEDGQSEYVRLDLQAVLENVATTEATSLRDDTTWLALLQSVAHCHTTVFRALELEMQELRTQLLPQMSALTSSVSRALHAELARVAVQEEPLVAHAVTAEPVAHAVEAAERSARRDATELQTDKATRLQVQRNAVVECLCDPAATPRVELAAATDTGARKAATPAEESVVPVVQTEPTMSEPTNLYDETMRGEMGSGSIRGRTQLYAQRAQHELEVIMAAMAAQWQLEQAQHDHKRREAALERASRAAMDQEDKAMRLDNETQRAAQEAARMQLEDILAQRIEAAWVHESQCQAAERQQMAQEEARTWRQQRQQRETQRKDKLVEQQSRLRRWHHRVMEELVRVVTSRIEAKRRAEELERRRVQREWSAMRSEEHGMRRLLIQKRAQRDAQRRLQNRKEMEMEDARASQRQQFDKQQVEGRDMHGEDQRSCVWETLWRLRIKKLRKWMESKPRRELRRRWERWRRVAVECRQRELQQKSLEKRRSHAAQIIQRCMARFADTMRALHAQEVRAACAEAAQAARIVQSAFRGFHVRRKFQNALDMAKTMPFDGENEFGEVDLDELIEAPPELDEDWGTPTLPQHTRWATELPEHSEAESKKQQQEEEEEEDEDDKCQADEVEKETARERGCQPRNVPPPTHIQQPPHAVDSGGNLAAQLWHRMRNQTLKLQHAREEKKRQQDPEYRAKKVLGKPTPAATTVTVHSANSQPSLPVQRLVLATTVATTVSWATNSDKKKALKVKLPSLVERLRKKTAAAR